MKYNLMAYTNNQRVEREKERIRIKESLNNHS
jgi:hypothetical protein